MNEGAIDHATSALKPTRFSFVARGAVMARLLLSEPRAKSPLSGPAVRA